MKKHRKSLSLQDLTLHQQRIRSIVRKINEYSPTFHINRNYNHSRIMEKIQHSRQEYKDRIFEQNMSIIQKLESVAPKVDTKRFPPVNLTQRSKRKYNSLSQRKFKKSPVQKVYNPKKEDKLITQNIQMIEKIQTIEKKIKCWQDKSMMTSRIIREKKQKQKRNEILQKFKQISKELRTLRSNTSCSRLTVLTPCVTEAKKRKESQASFETKANSFLIKKSFK